ncbi:hypothetical protein K8S19_09655 [bacterium]|nr:hypothetical protein [bacterium]
MIIKGVLKEELKNSRLMLKQYEKEIAKLPKGSLCAKNIKGRVYYYVQYREAGKIKFDYKGKELSDEIIQHYDEVKRNRAKLRNAASQLKKQIKYLKGTLRGKNAV